MKKIIFTLFAALVVQAQAFTLDFTAYNGQNLSAGSPLIVPVPGYGNVSFSATGINVLNVNTTNPPGDPAIDLSTGDVLIVTFLGVYPPYDINDVSFGWAGLSGLESAGLVITPIDGVTTSITFNAAGGAGLREVTFDAIPEPSTSLLGAVSVLAIALRRRRA